MTNIFGVILFLTVIGLVAWYGLKFFDWVHAVRYERRMAHRRALNEAFARGYASAMGEYSYAAQASQTFRVVLSTPDRPADPIKLEIESITGRDVAARFPKGS